MMLDFFRKSTIRALSISLIVSAIWIPNFTHAQGKKTPPVKFSEIKSWQRNGNNWASGYDKSEKLLAIYDLSFPTFLDRIELGFLDFSKENYDRIPKLLEKARANHSVRSPESDKLDQVITQLNELKTDPNFSLVQNGTVLQDRWWKEVPWNSSIRIQDDEAPESFLLSDINYHAVVTDKAKLDKQLAELPPNILSQFKFVKQGKKGYQIFWVPPRSGQNSDLAKVTQPRIIVDFRCISCGMAEGLGLQGLSAGLGGLVGLIPVPVIAGILNVAITEYFSFYRQLLSSHYQMAMEMIQTAEENPNANTPFASLSKEEREKAIDYLVYAEANLFTAIQFVKKKPAQVWKETKASAVTQARDSVKYLEGKGTTLDFLNPRFALGNGPDGNHRIYSLSAFRYWNIVPPFIAVDYKDPNKIYIERMIIESVRMLITFLKSQIPIPGVGTIASQIYELAIVSQMHAVQDWESRLSGHLGQRIAQGESWAEELRLLELQQINPFEIAPEKSARLIQAREREFRIPPYAPLN